MSTTTMNFDHALDQVRAWNPPVCATKRHATLMSRSDVVRSGRALTDADFERLRRLQPGIGGSTDGSLQS